MKILIKSSYIPRRKNLSSITTTASVVAHGDDRSLYLSGKVHDTAELAVETLHRVKGLQVIDEKLGKVNIQKANFHGKWNYIILPANMKIAAVTY